MNTDADTGIDDPPHIHRLINNWHDSLQILNAINRIDSSAKILWQYVPHMYGRGGVNNAVTRVMTSLKQASRRQTLIAHEIAAPWSMIPHHLYYALCHRRQWREILNTIDAIGISSEAWLDQWKPKHPHCFLAPSPSNIDRVKVSENHRDLWRKEHGLPESTRVLCFFGSQGRDKQFDWVIESWKHCLRRGKQVVLVTSGGASRFSTSIEEARRLIAMEYAESSVISKVLQAGDLQLLPFDDGVSERRGSFMAGLSNGIPVMTTIGKSTGRTLRRKEFFFSSNSIEKQLFVDKVFKLILDTESSRNMGRSGNLQYAARYSWNHLVDKIRNMAL